MTADTISSATGIITIDLGALVANWRALTNVVAPARCGAVVKADAYGLGADRVIPALVSAGCTTLFIATPDEARAARRFAPEATIFALDGLLAGSGEALIVTNTIPVLSSLPEVIEWSALAAKRGERLAAALHVDSGLNRLGLDAREVQALAADGDTLARLDVKLVMSHLACADDPADPKNAEQRAAFDKMRAQLPSAPASLAASDGLMLGPDFHYDLARPGYALYGGQAFKGGPTPVQPVVRVEGRILQVRDVAPGETVGYSATWVAQRKSRIAVVATGYADGFFRTGSHPGAHPGAVVSIGGTTAPLVGRISMDLITVDVTGMVPAPERGDLVTLVGPGISIEALGNRAGTIGYEVLTNLSRRFARVYVGENSA